MPKRGNKGRAKVQVVVKRTLKQPKPKAVRVNAPRGAFSRVHKAIAPALGGLAGLALGGAPGMAAGMAAGGAFNRIIGAGAYHLASGRDIASRQVPVMHGSETSIRVQHREFIRDVSSSIAFAIFSLFINPGISDTFPWLSTLAANFEQYRVRGIAFVFRSTSADALNSTNTALGTVIMAADYNANSIVPLNKTQMEQAMWAVSGRPSEDMYAPLEVERSETALSTMYVRTQAGDASAAHDIRFTDLARLDFATVGSQAIATVGELWVTYDIDLIKPVMNFGAPSSTLTAHYRATAVIAAATPLGTQLRLYDSIGLTISTQTITIPAAVSGLFVIVIFWSGGAVVGASPTVNFGNCTGFGMWRPGGANAVFTTGGTTDQVLLISIDVPISSSVSTVTIGATGVFSTTSCDILMTQMNSSTVGLTSAARRRIQDTYVEFGLQAPDYLSTVPADNPVVFDAPTHIVRNVRQAIAPLSQGEVKSSADLK